MRRGCFLAVALAVAAMVMGAGLLLARYLPRLLPRASGQEMLTAWVAENTGAELSTGYVTPLVYPGLGFQLRDLELKIPVAGRETKFLSVRAVKVVADREALFQRKKIVVRQLILVEPRIVLVREAGGRWNVSQWIKERPKKKPPNPEAMGLWRWMIYDSLKEIMPTADADLPHLLATSRISIEDADILVIDQKKKILAPIHLRGVNIELRGGNPARFTVALPFPPTDGQPASPLKLSGALRARGNAGIEVVSLNGSWTDLLIRRLAGEIAWKPKFSFDANLDASISYPTFKRLAMWPPIARSKTIPDTEGKGSGRIVARVWGPDPTRAAKVHYRGTEDLKDFTWDPGRVLAPIEHVTATIGLEDGAVVLPPTTVYIGGSVVHGSARMIEAHDPLIVIKAETDFIDFHRFFQPRRRPIPPGTPMGTMRTRWEGEAAIARGVYGKMKFTDAHGRFQVANIRLLTFPELAFRACGGSYVESGRSFIDFNHRSEVDFRFDGQARDVDISAFVDQVFNTTTFFHGRLDTEGYLTGKFISGKLQNRGLYGVLPVTVRDGYFAGYNFFGNVFRLFGAEAPEEYAGQQFQEMTATVKLRRAVAMFDDLKVNAGGMRGEAMGWIDFPGKSADIKIKLLLLRPVWGIIKAVPLLGVIGGPLGQAFTTLYVQVFGHWDKLQYQVWNPLETQSPPPPEIVGAPEEPAPAAGATPAPAAGSTTAGEGR